MTYLIDSDWVIDYLKGRPDAGALLGRLVPDGMAVGAITYAEVYEGIVFGRDRPHHERTFRGFLRGVRVLPVTRPAARRYAILRGTLRAQGQSIAASDLLIAATALHHALILVTRNERDFARVPGLALYESDA